MTNAHTFETALSRRYTFPVLAREGRPLTYGNKTQAYASVARLEAMGVSAFVTARWPFLVGIKLGGGADDAALQRSPLPTLPDEGRGSCGRSAESRDNRPATIPHAVRQ